MTKEELISKERRIKEIEAAAMMNMATDEMIQESEKLRKEIAEERDKYIDQHAEELLKEWNVSEKKPM
ncbi:MAG: hypothetical protein J6M44_02905 [Butyrivibrio sp.]|nr:hypothetical protein [Butyrivibrio sp.]